MTEEKTASGPEEGAEGDPQEDAEEIEITGEILLNIAMGEEECDDPKLFTKARKYAALMMRMQGQNYREIAAFLGVALSTAYGYVMDEVNKRVEESADAVRKIHLDRLNGMLAGVMDRANEGDTFAISAAMSIMTKIEALMGIEPAKKLEVSGPGGKPLNVIEKEMSPQEAAEAYEATLRAEEG